MKQSHYQEHGVREPLPAKCPNCGSNRIARMIFAGAGADPRWREESQARRAIPAGREPTGNDPRWRCLKCCWEWGHPHGQSGSSPGIDNLA